MSQSVQQQRPALSGNQTWADEALARKVLPRRSFGAHKWGVGGVIVIAGSPSFTGAAMLCSRAAGRAGAGIVYLASGRGVIGAVASAIPEVAHIPLPETESASGGRRAAEAIGERLEKSRAVVLGPGLGDDDASDTLLSTLFGFGGKRTQERRSIGFSAREEPRQADEQLEATLFTNEQVHVVIDADGLNWLAKQPEWWTKLPAGRAILTPHPGEMGRLLDRSADEITADPLATVEEAARRWNQTVVLKYGYSAASNGERTVVADDAPLSLATAGSGDVLAGVIGAFVAQGVEPVDAGALGLFAGTRAAQQLERRYGVLGVISLDLPEAIAETLAGLEAE